MKKVRREPEYHETREVTRFLVFPTKLPSGCDSDTGEYVYETRWLEIAKVLQVYASGGQASPYDGWEDWAWAGTPFAEAETERLSAMLECNRSEQAAWMRKVRQAR